MPPIRKILTIVMAVALTACLYISATRVHREAGASRVEIAMDWNDLEDLAHAYNYNPRSLLISMRRAGLTSLAVSEELGGSVNSGQDATVISGQGLIDQARMGNLNDAMLTRLYKTNKIDPNSVYLTVYTSEAQARYMLQLGLHFDAKSISLLRDKPPYLIQVRTDPNYFAAIGLGLPGKPMALVRDLHLFLIPRIQNDERFQAPQIDAEFKSFLAHERVSTVVFFGMRNQVLGFPDHVEDTAAAFRASHVNFGTIETYDNSQEQKGNQALAKDIVGQTVRVQAIAKTELDKLDFNAVVARYLLGARERNVRVIYLRPFPHQQGAMSIEATNIEMIRQIAQGLETRGLRTGRATPIPAFRVNPLVLLIATLAAPAAFLLAIEFSGVGVPMDILIAAFALDVAVFGAGLGIHREELVCKLIALAGGISFATLAVLVLRSRFTAEDIPTTYLGALKAGALTLLTGTAVALGGALLVIGLVSTPLTMEEVERFTGVKAILLAPPLIIIGVYLFTDAFRAVSLNLRRLLDEPVRVYQLCFGVLLLAGGVVYLARSGNQSDIAPSALELALRTKLTVLLSVRPRFKEFLIGFPALVLLPTLTPLHRKHFGWLVAICAAIGLADVIDTFSHLHTPLFVSLFRLMNGLVVGFIIGAVIVAWYRKTPITPAHFEVNQEA